MKKVQLLGLCLALLTIGSFLKAQNQNVSGGIVFEGEPFLTQNPANPNHLVVAWIGFVFQQPVTIKTRASFDGGLTWSTANSLPRQASTYKAADPSLAFDANGDVLACYISYRQTPDSGGVYVCRSTDGGLTWNNGSKAIDAYADGNNTPIDRPWMAMDQQSGNIYVTSMPPSWVALPKRPYIVRSTDTGLTWSNWQYLDGPSNLVGSQIRAPMASPVTSANGTLHIAYPSYVSSQNIFAGYYMASSSDGGVTFSYQDIWFGNFSQSDSLIKAGYLLLADPSDANHLAFFVPINLLGDQDIYMLETTNGGTSWQGPTRVNDDPSATGVTQDLVWADFDTDGDLVVTWRDRRNAVGTGYQVDSEIWGAVLWKDSTQFSPNFAISDTIAEWNTVLLEAGNDFMSTELNNDTLCAAWGDTRNGRLNIWFTKIDLRGQSATHTFHIADEGLPQVRISPNPSKDFWKVEGEGILGIELYDLNGKLLKAQLNGPVDCQNLENGIFVLQIKTEMGSLNQKVVVER